MSQPSRHLVVYADPEDKSDLCFSVHDYLVKKGVAPTPSSRAFLLNKRKAWLKAKRKIEAISQASAGGGGGAADTGGAEPGGGAEAPAAAEGAPAAGGEGEAAPEAEGAAEGAVSARLVCDHEGCDASGFFDIHGQNMW